MSNPHTAPLSIAYEGISDEAIAVRLCQAAGLEVGTNYNCRGKDGLDKRLAGFNSAARFGPWLVLRDLDTDAECAATLRRRLIPSQAGGMIFRIPVRAAESWLLADRSGISSYLKVARTLVPEAPDSLEHPKRSLVDLARRSKNRQIRSDMVPEPGFSTMVGSGYTSRIIDFARNHWDVAAAESVSDSLARALRDLRRLA